MPVYFQAVKDASPIRSGVDIFGATFTIAPFAMINGISVLLLNRYRPQNYLAWVLGIIGMVLFSTLKVDSSKGLNIGYQIVEGAGLGILFTATTFPILASVKVTEAAHALAFFTFIRSFAQVSKTHIVFFRFPTRTLITHSQTWGISIGSTILQNQLKRHLTADFLALFPQGEDITYAIITQIPHLPEALRTEIHLAFATSLSVLWKTMAGISALGLLSVLAMRELPMHTTTDENFGFVEKERPNDVERFSGQLSNAEKEPSE
jgi:hypothetical protein